MWMETLTFSTKLQSSDKLPTKTDRNMRRTVLSSFPPACLPSVKKKTPQKKTSLLSVVKM